MTTDEDPLRGLLFNWDPGFSRTLHVLKERRRRCEHPHLRGKGKPVPAEPRIFDDVDTGAGGPRRSRSPNSQRQARIPSAKSTRRYLQQRTSAVAPLLMHLHLPEFCVVDLRDHGGLPHALHISSIVECARVFDIGVQGCIGLYTYVGECSIIVQVYLSHIK